MITKLFLPTFALAALTFLCSCGGGGQKQQYASPEDSARAATDSLWLRISTPVDIQGVRWSDSLELRREELPRAIIWNFFAEGSRKEFTSAEMDVLAKDGFYMEETPPLDYVRTDDMVDLYNALYTFGYGQSYSTVPVFISSDFLLHVYHVVFDRMLQNVEENQFLLTMEALTRNLRQQCSARLADSLTPELREATERNVAFFEVAEQLFSDTAAPGPVRRDQVEQELALVRNAAGFAVSPLFGTKEDYSQYKPRGHYTVDENLSRYFRALMWYGRRSFSTSSEMLTLQAILISRMLALPGNRSLWESVDKPYRFIAGASDDLTFQDYLELQARVFGPNVKEEDLADRAKLHAFMEAAGGRAAPTISGNALADRTNPASIERGFRIMGQRAVPDARIFNDLTSPRVGTDTRPRNMPSVLDVMAVLGSPVAADGERASAGIQGFPEALKSLSLEFSGYDDQHWRSSMYWSWLNTLRPLLMEKGYTYPPFMRGRKWATKGLLTAAASWTELKHDTQLISKQSYAEMGEGEDEDVPAPPPQPRSYVEADLDFFNRFVSLVGQTREVFGSLGLLPDEYQEKFQVLASQFEMLRAVVKKELLNEPISHDEYEKLLTFAQEIEPTILPRERGDIIEDKYKQMALVSDVHTNAFDGEVLQEAVGAPQRIYVAVKDRPGGARVCVGYVYTHYEFSQPMSQRLTDDEWKAEVYPSLQSAAKAKEAPWSKVLRRVAAR